METERPDAQDRRSEIRELGRKAGAVSCPESDILALRAAKRILAYVGDSPGREGLLDTPARMVLSWDKLFGGYRQDPKEILSTRFASANDQMVIMRNIEFYSTCEHHMIPFFGRVHIGYIPRGTVVGISKLARLVECFARRLQIQEQLTEQIAEAIDSVLDPAGVAVMVEAQHLCMVARGVEKQRGEMVTTALRGVLSSDHKAREEFLSCTNGR